MLLPRLAALGCEVLDPWTLTDGDRIAAVAGLPYGAEKREAWRELSMEIGRDNAVAIEQCDALLAVLDGAEIDSGTAAEIGCACALASLVMMSPPIPASAGDVSCSKLGGARRGTKRVCNESYEFRKPGTIVIDKSINTGTTVIILSNGKVLIIPPGMKPTPVSPH